MNTLGCSFDKLIIDRFIFYHFIFYFISLYKFPLYSRRWLQLHCVWLRLSASLSGIYKLWSLWKKWHQSYHQMISRQNQATRMIPCRVILLPFRQPLLGLCSLPPLGLSSLMSLWQPLNIGFPYLYDQPCGFYYFCPFTNFLITRPSIYYSWCFSY